MYEIYECSCGNQQCTSSGQPPESCSNCGNSIPENFTYVGDTEEYFT